MATRSGSAFRISRFACGVVLGSALFAVAKSQLAARDGHWQMYENAARSFTFGWKAFLVGAGVMVGDFNGDDRNEIAASRFI